MYRKKGGSFVCTVLFKQLFFYADSSRKKGLSAIYKPLFLRRSAKKKKELLKRTAVSGHVNRLIVRYVLTLLMIW